MTADTPLDLETLEHNLPAGADDGGSHSAAELAPVFDVPVKIQAVLGKTSVDVATLLRLSRGSVLELDRKVGEAIDIYVNNRLVARGEVVLVEERLGVTMTEIIKDGEAS
jgi:flagellar motor switch protein FliN